MVRAVSLVRAGRFAAYNDLKTYYVGLGGNRNTTTRFRRYIGDPETRPLLPEHDRSSPDVLLVPNRKQKIILIADRNTIEYRRDGKTLFRLEDRAIHPRLVRVTNHQEPSANRTIAHKNADPLTTPVTDLGAQDLPGFHVAAGGVGVYNARPLAKAP